MGDVYQPSQGGRWVGPVHGLWVSGCVGIMPAPMAYQPVHSTGAAIVPLVYIYTCHQVPCTYVLRTNITWYMPVDQPVHTRYQDARFVSHMLSLFKSMFFFVLFLLSSFWTSCGLRCRPFSPPVRRAFSLYCFRA